MVRTRAVLCGHARSQSAAHLPVHRPGVELDLICIPLTETTNCRSNKIYYSLIKVADNRVPVSVVVPEALKF